MLHRVIGRSGSGKSEYLLHIMEQTIQKKRDCLVIVPEQQSLQYEKKVFTKLGSTANLYVEILNFERLPNRTYREYGNLVSTPIDDGGRTLVLAECLYRLRDDLRVYGRVCEDIEFIKKILSTLRGLKANGITAEMLSEASERMAENTRLADKLHDLTLIFRAYNAFFTSCKTGFSDGLDALEAYAEKLPEMPFFVGKTVLVDSFYTFTEQEYRILDVIAASADELYVSFLYDASEGDGVFAETWRAFRRVGQGKSCDDIEFVAPCRTQSPALKVLEQGLWNSKITPCAQDDGAVEFVACHGMFEEAEAAAASVLSLVRQGKRWRDIAVLCRDPSAYAGVLDRTMQKHGIPVFYSEKIELFTLPLVAFLLSAVEAAASNYSLPAMKRYLKSGYAGVTRRQSDRLTQYAELWQLRGKIWAQETDWMMHPKGYSDRFSPHDEQILQEINAARETVMQPLSALVRTLSAESITVSGAAKSLYAFLLETGADRRTVAMAQEFRRDGEEEAAQRQTQLWGIIIGMLDILAQICGDEPIKPARLLLLLRLLCGEYRVGAIPASADSVTIGGTAMFRADEIRAAVLVGVNDGEFPRAPSQDGLFEEDELVSLESGGWNVADTSPRLQASEKLFCTVACAAPSEHLTILWDDEKPSRPSAVVLRARALLPHTAVRTFGTCKEDLFFSTVSARENAAQYATQDSINNLISAGICPSAAEIAAWPLADPEASIPAEKGNISLSPSRLQCYTGCPFSYFGQYVLGLRARKKAEFSLPEIGTFIHRVLEIVLSTQVRDGVFIHPSEEDIANSVESLTDEYIQAVSGGKEISGRFQYTLKRLKATLKLLLKNLCDELANAEFVPTDFEVNLGATGQHAFVELGNGRKLYLNGVVDRVDTLKKNGETYLRIVDYKSGSKTFSRRAVENGLDLQLFVYLFALCRLRGAKPAGALYFPARIRPGETVDGAEDSIKRTGLLLNEAEILHAMDLDSGGRFLPKISGKGSAGSGALITLEGFGKLEESIERHLKKLADELSSGEMMVSPLKLPQIIDACAYCDMKPFCRLAGDRSVCRRNVMSPVEFPVETAPEEVE